MENYKERIADGLLIEKLAGKGAVLIEGTKWCGKTTTAEQIARSTLYLGDKDNQRHNLEMADFKPSRLLEGLKPRLLDEWSVISLSACGMDDMALSRSSWEVIA